MKPDEKPSYLDKYLHAEKSFKKDKKLTASAYQSQTRGTIWAMRRQQIQAARRNIPDMKILKNDKRMILATKNKLRKVIIELSKKKGSKGKVKDLMANFYNPVSATYSHDDSF